MEDGEALVCGVRVSGLGGKIGQPVVNVEDLNAFLGQKPCSAEGIVAGFWVDF